jgi:hypothetical protein
MRWDAREISRSRIIARGTLDDEASAGLAATLRSKTRLSGDDLIMERAVHRRRHVCY